ncbi:MAG: ankyrin repeat domain-containing protein, partial [bacterium]
IWQIVRHVLHWKRGVLSAWVGDPRDYQWMNETDWHEVDGDQDAWESDVKELREMHAGLRRRLEASSDEDLDQARPWYQSVPPRALAQRLLHVLTHDIYHAGQIQYLRALQEIPGDRFFAAAGWKGDVAVLRETLETNPDLLNAFDRSGWTALQLAAYTGHAEAVRFLLERGADVHSVSRNEYAATALKSAEIAGHAAIVEILRAQGA